jgi:hypothetical protein
VAAALAALVAAARAGDNLMEPSIACALARVTTGEWADALRGVFGEYRAVTGVDGQVLDLPPTRRRRCGPGPRRSSRRTAGGRGWWSASPASTATPTAPR